MVDSMISGSKGVRLLPAMVVTLLFVMAALALAASPAFASGTVTVAITGQGSAAGPGVSCTQSGGPDCTEFYDDTETCEFDPEIKQWICFYEPPNVELTAGPDSNGFAYQGWNGCESVTGRVCGLTVNQDTALTATFADVQAPSVSAPSPGGGVQRGTITLAAGASDNGSVQRVEFRVRGSLVGTDTSAPYSVAFNTASVADGQATLWATAYDGAGNSASSQSSVQIDNTAPTVTVNSGPDGETFGPGSTQTWLFSAADATSGISAVECSVVPAGSAESFAPCTGGGGSHSVSNRPGGDYTFTVRARDGGGLVTTSAARPFSIDDIAPITQIAGGIANGGATNQTSLTFDFSANEDGSTFACRVYPAALTPPRFGACSGTGTHTASGFQTGTYSFQVRATDRFGNVGSPVSRRFTVDTIRPTIADVRPASGTTIRDRTPTIRATVADDPAGLTKKNVALYLNGARIAARKYDYDATDGLLTYETPRLSTGKKTVKIIATDRAENMAKTAWFFTIR